MPEHSVCRAIGTNQQSGATLCLASLTYMDLDRLRSGRSLFLEFHRGGPVKIEVVIVASPTLPDACRVLDASEEKPDCQHYKEADGNPWDRIVPGHVPPPDQHQGGTLQDDA